MSAFNGSGTFVIVGAGLPFVPGTTISSTVANQLNADMATGLSTCITKDGQTTPTANIPLGGFKVTGLAVATATGDALSYGQAGNLTTLTLSGALTYGGVALSNSVSGTGSMVLSAGSTISGTFNASGNLGVGPLNTDPTLNRVNAVYVNSGQVLSRSVNGWDCGCANTSGTNISFYTDNGSRVSAGTISSNGSTTAYNTSSDARLKDGIVDAGDAGAIIDALRVRSWTWKVDGRQELFGFVAQEEVAVAPWAVQVGDDAQDTIKNQWGRDDSKLVPLLVKEIQSLRTRLAAAGL